MTFQEKILAEFDERFSLEWWNGFGVNDDINQLGIAGIKLSITKALQAQLEEILFRLPDYAKCLHCNDGRLDL